MERTGEVPVATLTGGVAMPLVGFGTWHLTGRSGYEAILHALRTGYRLLDTATVYRNEPEVGRALRDSGVRRTDVVVTTKLPPGNAGRERQTLVASLRALDLEYVDLWLVHWPPRGSDALVKTWKQLLALRDEGLARAVGVSNYSTEQIDALIETTGEAPAVNQVPWSPARHDPGMLAAMRGRGIVVEGYSSLKDTDLRHPVLTEIAQRHGVTPAQVVLRWHVEHGIVVIPKSGARERIETNFALFGFDLEPEEVGSIDGLARR